MKFKAGVFQAAILAVTAEPIVADAHPFHWASESVGFYDGLLHPLSASDHIITMLIVGFWISQAGRLAMAAIALVFAALLLMGGGLTLIGVEIAHAENIMNLSALFLGLLLASGHQVSLLTASIIAGNLALFHGYVHAYDIWLDSNALAYATGFALGTIALISIGILLRSIVKRVTHNYAAFFFDESER
ncbi:MAG: HupE/UreJ family protein [Methylomonas sp.]|jgi:urease accessory protein|uniref:HupE/UreJ family protein n=1 Tax=Methylomonas sp. TaxID=418 RepID=UPI0025E06134|nr:HupE/UreJ family protein [Methylomonas sp.]MCK9608078.1 HupE/UreJ family protein [Methylomonas sp.]